ncbi:uncharacterized protein LOC110692473 [Chenopodium quinoa]|uniref:uncharacterized protein LOC110692473 n=1 Tax=Chenopodium quinoa TaxID=63459 RepID=UPI000B78737F|nr:uncharacterized protein LOC110692473 [Chenopodium quinoa]XP_021725173.1 uncharacterized protein LOC110692473 [Chenopodium quinoa]
MGLACLKIYHGGKFKFDSNGYWVYLGGKFRTFDVDVDELCWFYMKELVAKCGNYSGNFKLYYLNPALDLRGGLKSAFTDDEFRELGRVMVENRTVDLYVVVDDVQPEFVKQSQTGSNTTTQPTSAIVATEHEPNRPKKLIPKRAGILSQASSAASEKLHVLEKSKGKAVEVVPTLTTNKQLQPFPRSSTSISLPENPSQTTATPTQTENTLEPHSEFIRCEVSGDYDWEEDRPNSPIAIDELLHGLGSDEDDDDRDYVLEDDLEGESDADEYEDEVNLRNEYEEEDWLGDYEIYQANYDLDGEDDDVSDIEELKEPEDFDADSSDDEKREAREKVKGFNCSVVELAQSLQVQAAKGNLAAQQEGNKGGESSIQVGETSKQAGEGGKQAGYNSEYEESDEEIHTPRGSDEEETIGERKSRRGLLVGLETDFTQFQWKVGHRFATREDFKQAVAKFAIFQGRNLTIVTANKSRQQRIGVRCSEGFPFRLYASWDSWRGSFVVKTVVSNHSCIRTMEKNKQLKGSWLAEQLLDVFKARPHWPAKEIIETVRRAYRVIIRKEFAYKVKWHAHKKLHGSMREHYGKVGRYLEALKRSSPNTQLDLVTYMDKNKPPQIFQRLYVCFEGLQKGWMEGCRKIICVDACFLKTFLGGQLMSAVGRDGNDQMYPIAWAVVEGKDNTSWEWFLNNLSKSLQLGDGSRTVIVSDEHQV